MSSSHSQVCVKVENYYVSFSYGQVRGIIINKDSEAIPLTFIYEIRVKHVTDCSLWQIMAIYKCKNKNNKSEAL